MFMKYQKAGPLSLSLTFFYRLIRPFRLFDIRIGQLALSFACDAFTGEEDYPSVTMKIVGGVVS